MWDAVDAVQGRDCGGERGVVCDLDAGEESVWVSRGLMTGWVDVLCFELVRQDQVGVFQQALVRRHRVFVDVYLAVVAHDGVKHCRSSAPCCRLSSVCDIPQKNEPGFVEAANFFSLAILPTSATTSALGQ